VPDETRGTVVLALAANVGVAVIKLAAGLLTGSAAVLSEAAHSVADTMNEVSCWCRCAGPSGPLTMRIHSDTAKSGSSTR
jgi:Cation efflux family